MTLLIMPQHSTATGWDCTPIASTVKKKETSSTIRQSFLSLFVFRAYARRTIDLTEKIGNLNCDSHEIAFFCLSCGKIDILLPAKLCVTVASG